MQNENKQFFNGFLLGSLLAALVVGTVIILFVIDRNSQLNDLEYQALDLPHSDKEPVMPLVQLSHEIGSDTAVLGQTYQIRSAFYDPVLNVTYRTLTDDLSRKSYPSLWDGAGERLDYFGSIDLLTAAGGETVVVKKIHSNHEIILVNDNNDELIYNLEEGMIYTYEGD